MKIELTKKEKAIKVFESHGIYAYERYDAVFVCVDELHVECSELEVEMRADQFNNDPLSFVQ